MAESLAPPLNKDPGIQGRRRSHPPVRCRDLGSLSESRSGYWSGFTNAACAPSLEVLKRASLSSIESVLLQVQLRWAGHITRMEDVRMPKAAFFSELQEGKRDRGEPRKPYKDQLKWQLAQAGISHQSWQQEASDRDSWRSSVRKASCKFEAERQKAAKEKHRRQKERAASLPYSSQTFLCPKCGRGCQSRIGLYSHQRACKN